MKLVHIIFLLAQCYLVTGCATARQSRQAHEEIQALTATVEEMKTKVDILMKLLDEKIDEPVIQESYIGIE